MASKNLLVICIFSFLLVGYITGRRLANELDINDLEKKLNTIPGIKDFNSSQFPSEEDIEKVMKEKCIQNGGGVEAYKTLKNQQAVIQSCIDQHLNASEIQNEIEEAQKTGSMDEVFGKYCNRYPEVYKCVEGVTEAIKPCLDDMEKETMYKALNITAELKEFVCFKDGDRIAMFIAEGGMECLESRKEGLQECANKTIGQRIPTDLSIDSLPMFMFGEGDCKDFNTLRSCVNKELEKCEESTPSNIVDAVFKFLSKQMPCNTVAPVVSPQAPVESKRKSKGGNSGSIHKVWPLTIVATIMILKFL